MISLDILVGVAVYLTVGSLLAQLVAKSLSRFV